MANSATKIKKELELGELSDFLRNLADAFDPNMGGFELIPDLEVRDFYKFELKMKRYMTAVTLKIKIEQEALPQDQSASDEKRPKYKEVKKRLQISFKAIGKCLSENYLPEPDIIQSFIRDALITVSFPGYGDDHYETFVQACNRLVAGYENKNFAVVRNCFDEIDRLKKACHDLYK